MTLRPLSYWTWRECAHRGATWTPASTWYMPLLGPKNARVAVSSRPRATPFDPYRLLKCQSGACVRGEAAVAMARARRPALGVAQIDRVAPSLQIDTLARPALVRGNENW